MAAYCRVSTDQEEQLSSYENQVKYYKNFIETSDAFEFAGIYADEGISGTNTKKRDEFNRMIADCRAHKIDRIITKSISRFARNTLDCLNYVRELKELGIGVTFEKENIDTLDAKGEVLLTILSSLAQDESRSISKNTTWGLRKRYEDGKFKINTMRFIGYDNDENGKLVVNKRQAKIVKRLFMEYLSGKTVDYIKRIFEREGIKSWNGVAKWHGTTLQNMLSNEKYMGDAILQKSYTVDFLTKKRAMNDGRFKKIHIKDDHEAIIDPLIWEAVQLEEQRRNAYIAAHGLNSYSKMPEQNPFFGKVICGECNLAFGRKHWFREKGSRKIWQCQNRYPAKGEVGCTNRHIDEATVEQAVIIAWNRMMEQVDEAKARWEHAAESGNPLELYRAMQFSELAEPIKSVNTEFILKVLDYITVYENGAIEVKFLDGANIELG